MDNNINRQAWRNRNAAFWRIFLRDFCVNLWRNLWRDLRSGDLTLLVAAVVLAVSAMSAVGLFANRLSGALARDAQQLLGGDAVVVSDQPTPASITQLAQQYGLQSTSTLTFATMAVMGERSQLVALKAVENGYPLHGKLKINGADNTVITTSSVPQKGEIWVDNNILLVLNASIGDTLMLGQAPFVIQHVLIAEPDRGLGFLNFAPRVLMNSSDLAATQLIQPASRVTYRFAIAGNTTNITRFNQAVQALLPQLKGVRLDSLASGRPETRQVMQSTEDFLNLVALLCAFICAVAIAISARRFAASRLDACAMRRVLGQSQTAIATLFAAEFLLVGLVAGALGCVIGWGVHQAFVAALAQLMDAALPAPDLKPIALGMGAGLCLLLGFGLPPALQLAQTPPLRVLRRDMGTPKVAAVITLALGLAGFVILLLSYTSNLKLAGIAIGGFAAAWGVIAALAYALLLGFGRVQPHIKNHLIVLAMRQLLAQRLQTVVQVSCLSIGLLALLLLTLLRSDLLAHWQSAKASDAPNRMVINILPDQAQDFKNKLDVAAQNGWVEPRTLDWYPMIRGRLIAVNDAPIHANQFEDERAKRLVEREFNLSHTAQLPSHNVLADGRWINEEDGAISIEEGIAKTLRLKLGDRLRFDIAGAEITATITSVRTVNWQSMRANFFVLFPKSSLPDLPLTYLAAYKAYADTQLDRQLLQAFPNITLIDLTHAIVEIGQVIRKVSSAIESLFAFTLVAGALVLLATLLATAEHTKRNFALMRALGASRVQLQRIQSVQLAGIGALSGFLAACLALALAFVLATWVFQFEWLPPLWLPLAGAALGAGITLAVGRLALRGVLNQAVITSLRATS